MRYGLKKETTVILIFQTLFQFTALFIKKSLTANYFKYENVLNIILEIEKLHTFGFKVSSSIKKLVESLEDDIPNDV